MARLKFYGRCLAAVLLAWGLAPAGLAAGTQEIGPLPALKYDKAKARLGKRLFYDKRISGDAGIACATCHMPDHGFSHPDALAPGYPGNKHFRNSPGLINVAHKKSWMHDGRLGTNLNDVTREMLTEDYLMNMDMRIMQERIKQDPAYVEMFEAAGFGEPSNGGVRNAIPEFLKSLRSRGAPFDTGTMSELAAQGEQLFRGKAGCIGCHNGPLFSDDKDHNLGVPENFDIFRDPLRHQAFIAYNMFLGNENYMSLKRDLGTHVRSHEVDGRDMGKFMTPSLRELKHTAPYMHNGVLQRLADVVAFYDRGGGRDENKDSMLKPLRLTAGEKAALVAFLEALSGDPLTGEEFVWSEPYPDEYPVIADWRNVRN